MSTETPHYLGHRQRLRERFLKSGLAGLADYEVVELLLTLAIPRSDVKQPAKRLLKRFGSLRGILDAPIEELREIDGIGSVTPIALQIIRAAATLCLQLAAEGSEVLSDPVRISAFWRMRIGNLTNELFQVAYLKPSGAIGFYHPDWVVVQKTKGGLVNWIIETKGRVWEGTTAKDDAIRDWCERITHQTRTPWRYCRVNQMDFDGKNLKSFAEAVA